MAQRVPRVLSYSVLALRDFAPAISDLCLNSDTGVQHPAPAPLVINAPAMTNLSTLVITRGRHRVSLEAEPLVTYYILSLG